MLGFLNREIRQAREAIVQSALRAEAFDISRVLARYQTEAGVGQTDSERLWRELVRFLMMVAHTNERGYGMHGPADQLWHHFVLHTELYQAFCERHAGRFLHHHPADAGRAAPWRSDYLRFLVDYRTVFQEPPPEDIWTIPAVPGIKLPEVPAKLDWRHVKAMAVIERRWQRGKGGGPHGHSKRGVDGSDPGGPISGCGGGGSGCGGGGDG